MRLVVVENDISSHFMRVLGKVCHILLLYVAFV